MRPREPYHRTYDEAPPAKVCAVCKHVLSSQETSEGTRWLHGLPTDSDHPPIPVVAEATNTQAVCDFCRAPDPRWTFPTRAFDVPEARFGSVDDWAACDICHALIEADDRDGLTRRSVAVECQGVATTFHKLIDNEIRLLHGKFFANRMGPSYLEASDG